MARISHNSLSELVEEPCFEVVVTGSRLAAVSVSKEMKRSGVLEVLSSTQEMTQLHVTHAAFASVQQQHVQQFDNSLFFSILTS